MTIDVEIVEYLKTLADIEWSPGHRAHQVLKYLHEGISLIVKDELAPLFLPSNESSYFKLSRKVKSSQSL